MQSSSALYIRLATIAIVGQGGMKELKGQGSSGDYHIFYIGGSSKVHLETLKIVNGHVSMNIFVLLHHVYRIHAFDCWCGCCGGYFIESKYKDLKGRQKICGVVEC